VIETRDLTKKYDELFAVKSLSLKLEKGDVYGFIGPNGAGKTTTMRMLATLLNPTWGEAYVCGYSIYTKPKEIRRAIGFMPDFFGVYDDMKVIEYLEFFAAAYRINGEKRRKVCEDVLELVGLGYKRDALATSLSRGMNQRLGLARVLLHDPQVLLLDEPASGLDPRVRIEIRRVIRQLGEMGKTVMVSSHILPELADMCNKIGIIERGELLVDEKVDDLIKRVRPQIVLRINVQGSLEAAAKIVEQHDTVDRVEIATGENHMGRNLVVTLKIGAADYSDLATQLIAAGHKLTLFKEDELNLEGAFMALTKGITA
jgi:ABC-2 type transport system ATP-binding protein